MIEICNKQDCVGCSACFSVCKKKAIKMQPDALGFLYPVIDQNLCIDCGLCVKSCFNNQKLTINEPVKTCVGYASDHNEQVTSTSGGLASVFMREILKKGGVVYGCSGENAYAVQHIRIENVDDIDKLKGSKYVQSYMGLTYQNVVVDLRADRTVLFIGTPCQVAGLKAFLGDKIYNKLYTVDFVCHGVPSQQILNDAIGAKIKNIEGLRLVNRVKEGKMETKYTLCLLKDQQKVCDEVYPSKGYITGFLCGLYYRENCYQCQFAKRKRVSDVTLGDFWDKDNKVKGLSSKKYGLSMIMANTAAGVNLLTLCGDSFKSVEWDYEDFIKRNGQLKGPIRRHLKRDQFEKLYSIGGYSKAISETLDKDLKNIRKNILLNKISVILYCTPIIRTIYKKLRKK